MRIWGIIEELETLDDERLIKEISNMNAQIHWIYDELKYADHGAYGQDQNRITMIRRDISTVQSVLDARKKC